MNTILTDDALIDAIRKVGLRVIGPHKILARAVEAAVLAKLREQEPVGVITQQQADALRRQRAGDLPLCVNIWPPKAVADNDVTLYTHPAPQQADRQQIYDAATHASAMAVFMTRMDAEQPDADDKGVSGWLQDAEDRIRSRASQPLEKLISQADRQRMPDGWVNAVQKIADENEVEPSFVTMVFDDLLPAFLADKDAAGYVTLPRDSLIENDSYGVYGSDFYRCKVCGAESGAGVLNKGIQHNHNCPLAAAPEAPATAVVQVPQAVAYLDVGAGGYLDLGSDLTDEQLQELPKGRHMLAIVGTFGVDGYTPAAPEAPAQAIAVDDDYKGWYCAHCQRGVDAREVTFHEQHEACGRVITEDRPPKAQASAVDERQPLTPERVDELSHEMARGNKSVNWLVRAIERAHGIGDSALAQKDGAA